MTARTVRGYVETPVGSGVPCVGARVAARLYTGPTGGLAYGTVNDVVVGSTATLTNSSGYWALDLEPNDNIIPTGTVWAITTAPPDQEPIVYYIEVPDTSGPHDATDLLAEEPGALPTQPLAEHIATIPAHGGQRAMWIDSRDYDTLQAAVTGWIAAAAVIDGLAYLGTLFIPPGQHPIESTLIAEPATHSLVGGTIFGPGAVLSMESPAVGLHLRGRSSGLSWQAPCVSRLGFVNAGLYLEHGGTHTTALWGIRVDNTAHRFGEATDVPAIDGYGIFESDIGVVYISLPTASSAAGIHLRSRGDIVNSSNTVRNARVSGGAHGLLSEDFGDIVVTGGSYLSAFNEGVNLESNCAQISGVHAENNCRGGTAEAGIKVQGGGSVAGCFGAQSLVDSTQKYACEVFASTPGMVVMASYHFSDIEGSKAVLVDGAADKTVLTMATTFEVAAGFAGHINLG